MVDQTTHTPKRSAAVQTQVGAAGPTYRILRTNEFDAKDTPTPVAPFSAPVAPVGDDFAGEARKSAKLVLAEAPVEDLADVGALIATLPADTAMVRHRPRITTAPDSGRVAEENRNVRLRAFLYAASREADNDFHLIVGGDPNSEPHVYMTNEISGLPPREATVSPLSNRRATPTRLSSATTCPGRHTISTIRRSRSRSKARFSST